MLYIFSLSTMNLRNDLLFLRVMFDLFSGQEVMLKLELKRDKQI